jgi:hypothetical protein
MNIIVSDYGVKGGEGGLKARFCTICEDWMRSDYNRP